MSHAIYFFDLEKINRERLNYTLIDLSEQDKMLLSKRSNNLLNTTKIVELHSKLSHDVRVKYSIPPKLENIQSRLYEIVQNRKGKKYDIRSSSLQARLLDQQTARTVVYRLLERHFG